MTHRVKTAPVSVVIPCYRCAETIDRAVASVISQTLRPLELILVDDASGDGTLPKLRELRDVHGEDWIRVISMKRNSGPSVARNAGWEVARGYYIAFLDADDSWHPKKIEIQYRWMANRPDLAIGGHRCLVIANDDPPGNIPCKRIRSIKAAPFPMLFANILMTRSVMIRRTLPFRFHPEKKFSEDYFLWLEIILNGYSASVLDIPLAYSYKAAYGESGLTENLMEMEKGELDTFRRLYQKRLLSAPGTAFFFCFSVLKFFKRLAVCLGQHRNEQSHNRTPAGRGPIMD